jgi:hypothetical protein
MFEKYQKAARDIPNKKEREEIETMKNAHFVPIG